MEDLTTWLVIGLASLAFFVGHANLFCSKFLYNCNWLIVTKYEMLQGIYEGLCRRHHEFYQSSDSVLEM